MGRVMFRKPYIYYYYYLLCSTRGERVHFKSHTIGIGDSNCCTTGNYHRVLSILI